MRMKLWLGVIAVSLLAAGPGFAAVVISEILADPAKEMAGDANSDGLRSSAEDEFVELHNTGPEAVDVSSWQLQDNKKVRHVFPENTIIKPQGYIAVFGGSQEELRGPNWQVASSGSLGLDNGGDTVMLLDANSAIIDRVEYTSAGAKDQSLVIERQGGEKVTVLHSTLTESAGALFSPGKSVAEGLVQKVQK